ncbi:unnamed protein product, partial [Phaeothamnion confervicola]
REATAARRHAAAVKIQHIARQRAGRRYLDGRCDARRRATEERRQRLLVVQVMTAEPCGTGVLEFCGPEDYRALATAVHLSLSAAAPAGRRLEVLETAITARAAAAAEVEMAEERQQADDAAEVIERAWRRRLGRRQLDERCARRRHQTAA